MILPFRQFNIKMLDKLNRWLREFNKLNDLRGDEFILIKKSGAGTVVSFNLAKARERIAKKGGDSANPTVRAACTADAGAGSTIAATLYKSDGTTGAAITVHCNISNGSALNAATPRLEDGDDIFVTLSNFDNAGTPESRHYCVSNFQTTEDCACS